VTVNTRHVPSSSLLTYVSGQSWIVDYYSQVIDRDNAVSGQQRGKPADQQPYRLIKGMELRVSSALNDGQTQEADTKSMQVRGSATIYPCLVPNVGDMFIADVGDGREGVFQVTQAERKTIFKDTVHTIEYELISYNDLGRREDFRRKTTVTYHFVRDFLHHGQSPLIIDELYNNQRNMIQMYQDLLGSYFRDFYSHDLDTLIVPDQSAITYDPFMVRFVQQCFEANENAFRGRMRSLNVGGDRAMEQLTVLDAIAALNGRILPTAVYKMQLVSTNRFKDHVVYNGIFYTKVRDVVFPAEVRTDVDANYTRNNVVAGSNNSLQRSGARVKDIRRLIRTTAVPSLLDLGNAPEDVPDINRVADSDYYIFTERFYHSRSGQRSTKMEIEVHKLLRGEPMDNKVLMKMATECGYWDNLERFYFIPILCVLLKIAYRSNPS